MAAFGGSGFFMAYGMKQAEVGGLIALGSMPILVYLLFYTALFGVDKVKWMAINAALGIYGISIEVGWILALFGKKVSDYSWYVHIVPFTYYVLYTFLLRQAVLDISGAREDEKRRKRVDQAYVWGSLAVYSLMHIMSRKI